MRVILLGPPGGGKGTQGELIEKQYGFPKISTGDLLRREVQEKTALGEMAKAKMNQGELVNDDIVIEMIKHKIFQPDCKRGYILDGFPRNVGQARRL
jgi:adenylate kinase